MKMPAPFRIEEYPKPHPEVSMLEHFNNLEKVRRQNLRAITNRTALMQWAIAFVVVAFVVFHVWRAFHAHS